MSIDHCPSPFTHWKQSFFDLLELCKPRVILLMLLAALVGMVLSGQMPAHLTQAFFGLLAIALSAGSAAVINHMVDQPIDALMKRTENRPLPKKRVTTQQALIFSISLAALSALIFLQWVNLTALVMTFSALLGYAVVYSVFLKHYTSQNIVIGGLSGACPPLLGWLCITGHFSHQAWLLVLIIFTWTPAHFWALSIYRLKDYQKANVPMLPVTHGIDYTKYQIFFYTMLTLAASLLPYASGLLGNVYLALCLPLNFLFLHKAYKLQSTTEPKACKSFFLLSNLYLTLLLACMLIDHFFNWFYAA
jgi:heme o synthase